MSIKEVLKLPTPVKLYVKYSPQYINIEYISLDTTYQILGLFCYNKDNDLHMCENISLSKYLKNNPPVWDGMSTNYMIYSDDYPIIVKYLKTNFPELFY